MAAGMADGLRKPQARPEGGVSICSWARRVGFSLLADPFPLRIGVRKKFLHCFIASTPDQSRGINCFIAAGQTASRTAWSRIQVPEGEPAQEVRTV